MIIYIKLYKYVFSIILNLNLTYSRYKIIHNHIILFFILEIIIDFEISKNL